MSQELEDFKKKIEGMDKDTLAGFVLDELAVEIDKSKAYKNCVVQAISAFANAYDEVDPTIAETAEVPGKQRRDNVLLNKHWDAMLPDVEYLLNPRTSNIFVATAALKKRTDLTRLPVKKGV
jgi:hypothetical protein